MSYKPQVKHSNQPLYIVEYHRNNVLQYSTNCGSLVESLIVAFNKAREFDPITNPDTINSQLYGQLTYNFEDHTVRVSKVS